MFNVLTKIQELDYGVAVMRPQGVLDVRSYRQVRDAVIKAALNSTTAVVIDVDELEVPDDYAWTVFTSVRWHVQQYPQVIIALASTDPAVRRRLERMSISRFVPVFAAVPEAVHAIGDGTYRYRQCARTQISKDSGGVRAAQLFVVDHLEQWSMKSRAAITTTVTTFLVENALTHTESGCALRLEAVDEEIIVSVADSSTTPAVRHEAAPGPLPGGLDIIAAVCRHWGSTPRPEGKTVWARIGPDDSLLGIVRLLT